jgi:hypothetical protein
MDCVQCSHHFRNRSVRLVFFGGDFLVFVQIHGLQRVNRSKCYKATAADPEIHLLPHRRNFIANLHSIKFILSRQNKPRPLIVKFRTGLLTDTARVLLANSISLTPGTITISLDGEIFTVHCLDASMADGLENSRLVHILMQIEKGAVQ